MNLINNLRLMGAMLVILLFSSIASTTAFAGEKFSGELNAAKPNVTHTIHMPVNGTLTIEITASKKQNIAGITLRDSDNKTVLGSGSRVSNKTTTNKFSLLRAGSYYLELRKDGRTSYYGSYAVDTRVTGQPFANDTEANDTFNTTGLLDVRTTVTGHLGARGQQQEQDIRDYWKLTMPSDGELALEVTTSKGLNLRGGVYIYDSDRKHKLYGEYQGPDSKKVHRLAALRAGTYYVLLEKDGRASYWGSYQLKASVNRQPFANDAVANDTFDTASLLNVRATVAGHLGSRGQQRDQDMRDYWKLTIPSDGELALEVTTSKGLNLRGGVYIYDSDRKNKLYGEHQGPDSKKVHRLAALKAGTYYILLEKDGRASYWGSYQLKASFTPVSTASDKHLPSASHDSGDLSNSRVSYARPGPQIRPENNSTGVKLENGNRSGSGNANRQVVGLQAPVDKPSDPCNQDKFAGQPALWIQNPNDYIFDPTADSPFDVDMGHYDEAVSEAMQAMRQVAPPQTAKQQAQFDSLWLPMFDYPSPKGMVYLNQLNPMLKEFLGLTMSAKATLANFEVAWYEAEMAASYESEAGAAEAMALVMQIAEQLKSIQSRLARVQEKIQVLGGPPNPVAGKCKARQRTKAAINLFRQEKPEHSCAPYWRGDVKTGTGRMGLMDSLAREDCDINFTGMAISCGDRSCSKEEERQNKKHWEKRQRDLKIAYREWRIKEGRGDPGVINGSAAGSERGVSGQGAIAQTKNQAALDAPALAKELQEKVAYHKRNIEWLKKDLQISESMLSKIDVSRDKDGRQRQQMQRLIITKRADLQGEYDAITTAKSGNFTHTRTVLDDINYLRMQELAAQRRAKFDGTTRIRASIERMVSYLDPAERHQMRQWVRKQTSESSSDKEQLKKVGQVINNKLLGYALRQQAESMEGAASAQLGIDLALGYQSYVVTPTMLIGGAIGGVPAGLVAMRYGILSGAVSGYYSGSSMDRLAKNLYEEYGKDGLNADRSKTDAGKGGMIVESIVSAASYINPVIYYGMEGVQAFYARETVTDPKTGKVTTKKAGYVGAGKELLKLIVTQKIIGAAKGYFPRGQALQKQAKLDAWKNNNRSLAFKQERAMGKAVAQEVQARYNQLKRLKASAAPRAAILTAEQRYLDQIAAVKQTPHAKGYLKFNASAKEKLAYNTGDRLHTRRVVKEFKAEMARSGYDISKLKFTQFRNAGNTTPGMDMDLGVQPLSGVRVSWTNPNSGQTKLIPLDKANQDFQKIFNGVYKKQSGGRSAGGSWQTITTSKHLEAYNDMAWINLKNIKDPSKVIRYSQVEQAAKVTEFKADHMQHQLGSQDNKNWEIMRGTAKDIRTKLLRLIDRRVATELTANNHKVVKELTTKRNFFDHLAKAMDKANQDPVEADKAIKTLTGRTSPEIIKMVSAALEMAGKF